jgi:hypothetical protein
MKKALKKLDEKELYYIKNGQKILGVPSEVTGDTSGIWDNVSASNISGNVSHLR